MEVDLDLHDYTEADGVENYDHVIKSDPVDKAGRRLFQWKFSTRMRPLIKIRSFLWKNSRPSSDSSGRMPPSESAR